MISKANGKLKTKLKLNYDNVLNFRSHSYYPHSARVAFFASRLGDAGFKGVKRKVRWGRGKGVSKVVLMNLADPVAVLYGENLYHLQESEYSVFSTFETIDSLFPVFQYQETDPCSSISYGYVTVS